MTIASAASLRTRAAAVRRLYYFCIHTGALGATTTSLVLTSSIALSPRTRMPCLRRWQSSSCFSLLFVAATSNYFYQPTRAFLPPPTSFVSRNTSSNSIMNAAALSSSSSSPPPPTEATTTDSEQDKGVSTTNTVMAAIQSALENSWVRQLSSESAENLDKSRHRAGLKEAMINNNKTKRPVFNGHYVLVKPTPLPEPRLILYSSDVANNLLGLTNEQVESDEDFVKWVSGHDVLPSGGGSSESWATPYALSIMGTRYTNNCPYGTGDGYGDGRAISIGEFHGYELQLKGAGTTPFHRGADGRAVLRSSIREFLASEAMHHLGVATTRALSLVVSEKETVQRPWYAENTRIAIPSIDDPRLAQYNLAQRKEILERLRQTQKADPNMMITEKAAITCRVASSFTRIGHLDLFARRVNKSSQQNAAAGTHDLDRNGRFDTSTNEWKELEEMVWHACYREYRTEAYDPYYEQTDISAAATVLLQESAHRLATMVGNWIRVGFAQGNFNADNCLIAGKTMDYGPFGWMEEYNPVFAKWTGSGEHFGFVNQPSAAYANYAVLVESVVPVIAVGRNINNDEDAIDKLTQTFLKEGQAVFENEIDQVFRAKLGFLPDQDVGDDVWSDLEPLLRKSRSDWTLFWRQLTYIMRDFNDLSSTDYSGMLSQLELTEEEKERKGASPFYEPLTDELRKDWLAWIEKWRTALVSASSSDESGLAIYERMRTKNPKFVLREWMLVNAYNGAANDEEAELFNLFDLIKRPYDEGSETDIRKYYRRAPDEALLSGGTAFMS